MNEPQKNRKRILVGCALFTSIIFLCVLIMAGLIYRSMTNFEGYRNTLGIRPEVKAIEPRLRYSPGIDGILWAKFKVKASTIGEVFQPGVVNPKELQSAPFKISVDWITNHWWDPEKHILTGGEIEIRRDEFMSVGFVDNQDGTLTVYIYWFEV